MFRFLICLIGFSTCVFSSSLTLLENPVLFNFAQQNLPHEGVLKQEVDGFLYVKIPEGYIYELIPFLSEKNVCIPPYFGEGLVGAHITVATAEEMGSMKEAAISYLGKSISFSLVRLERLEAETLVGSVVYCLIVDSPQISEIRKSLGLSPKLNGYDFHVTIAVNCKKTTNS